MPSADNAPYRTATGPMRWLLLALAVLCLGLGLVGLVLPVVPTVPFLILSAWAAARSSPRLARWLDHHPHFGPLLRDWRDGGLVPRRAKWLATAMMSGSAVFIVLFVPLPWVNALAIGCMAGVAIWLWRRPERRASVDS